MALQLQHLPSPIHLSTQQQQQQQQQLHNQTTFLSLHNRNHSITHFSLRLSKQTRPLFPLRFASTSQQQQQQRESEGPTEEYSQTRLLAQNVPWTSTPEDIRSLFEKHGKVLDVELSMYNKTRNRGLAFVEMGSPEEALEAFKNLESYEFEGRTIKMNYAKPKAKKTRPPAAPKPAVTFNLFVANLSYEARSKDLKEFFDSGSGGSGSVVSAEIIFHDNPRRSTGYGFVSFKSKKQAEEALSEFQGKIFMERPIRVARSNQFVQQRVEESAKSEDASSELSVNEAEAYIADKDASSELSVNEAEENKAD